MKKNYIAPNMITVLVREADILAGSPSFEDGEVGSGDAKDRLQFDVLTEEDINLFD